MKPTHTAHEKPARRSDARGDGTISANTREGESPGRGRHADRPKDIPKVGWKDILWRTKEQMKEDNLSIVAAGVAFYIFLGLFPALAALISIWGLVADPGTIQEQIASMGAFLPGEVLGILDQQMGRIANQSAGATLGAMLGILLAIWSGAKAMKAVIMALNITYDEDETRSFIRLNMTALLLTFAGIAALLLVIGLIAAGPGLLEKLGAGTTGAAVMSILRWPLLGLFGIIALGTLYRYAPDRNPARWRWVSWGAVIATLVWVAVSAGFSFYVGSFGNYNKTYGSLGAVVVLMLWLLISAYVVLLGAELNAEMEHQTAQDTTRGGKKARGERRAFVADDLGESRRN